MRSKLENKKNSCLTMAMLCW